MSSICSSLLLMVEPNIGPLPDAETHAQNALMLTKKEFVYGIQVLPMTYLNIFIILELIRWKLAIQLHVITPVVDDLSHAEVTVQQVSNTVICAMIIIVMSVQRTKALVVHQIVIPPILLTVMRRTKINVAATQTSMDTHYHEQI